MYKKFSEIPDVDFIDIEDSDIIRIMDYFTSVGCVSKYFSARMCIYVEGYPNITIWYSVDEWWWVLVAGDFYRCDQVDGLLSFLSDSLEKRVMSKEMRLDIEDCFCDIEGSFDSGYWDNPNPKNLGMYVMNFNNARRGDINLVNSWLEDRRGLFARRFGLEYVIWVGSYHISITFYWLKKDIV